MTESESARRCPACGADASGRFCASCGSALEPSLCAACRTSLAPGSSFCHHCGAPVGARLPAAGASSQPKGLADSLPWIVAGIALLALVGLVAWQRLSTARSAAPVAQAGAPFATGGPGGRAPDISGYSPRQLATLLYERVLRLHAEGKPDSVAYYAATMAIPAFQMLDAMDADARYELGRVAEVSGALPLARAQADSILNAHPDHLLGLVLAARVASAEGDASAQRRFEQRLLAAEERELAKDLPEYQAHLAEIQTALAEARRRG
jgi:hypothetical protein